MITNAILFLLSGVVNAVDALLPHATLPSWLAGSTVLPSSVAETIGGMMGALSPFLPVSDVLSVLTSLMAFLPVVFAYVVFQWVYRHIPTVAGFGVGPG